MLLATAVTDILAICAIVGAAISAATLVYAYLRDRQTHARDNAELLDRLMDELQKLTSTVVGSPPANGFPAVEGFMQDHERRLSQLETT
jgi:hypothetical protein